MFKKNLSFLVLSMALGFSAHAAGASLDEAIGEVAHHWAKVYYSTPDKEKSAAFEKLSVEADQVRLAHPGKAEPMIWEAIVLSSAAKADGGLGALGKVKQARDLLLSAEKIDPTALNGSVYNSLGSLYAKVPGWPIAFGDKDKARAYLEKALTINPKGIDPNYFYGDLLADQGEYAKAVEHLKRALEAPARPGREDADAGRRGEINRLLQSIQQKHGDQLASK